MLFSTFSVHAVEIMWVRCYWIFQNLIDLTIVKLETYAFHIVFINVELALQSEKNCGKP